MVVEQAEWECKEDPNGYTIKFSLRNNGFWVRSGLGSGRGTSLHAGWRYHFDYSF